MPRHADPTSRDSLVAAARAEFARKGLLGARIEDITAACGLSKGAFYLHFESKEALFEQLVQSFFGELDRCTRRREDKMAEFLHDTGGHTPSAAEERRFLEMETAEDLIVLELMWSYRDVLGVLVRGAQGTRFEGAIWEMTDREVERIKENTHRFQGRKACRSDIPPEIFGSMIVGTYMLLGMRMSRMEKKPDLREWAQSLHVLIREGSAPRPIPKKKSVQRRAS